MKNMRSAYSEWSLITTSTSTNIANKNAIKVKLHVLPESKFLSILLHFNIISYNALTIAMATSLAGTPGEVRKCKVK